MKTKPILLFLALLCGAVCSFAQAAALPVKVGQRIDITVVVGTGTPPFTLTWFHNDVRYAPTVPPVVSADGKTFVMSILNAQLTDAGTYMANVYNDAGNSNTAYVSATVTAVIILPGNTTITAVAR